MKLRVIECVDFHMSLRVALFHLRWRRHASWRLCSGNVRGVIIEFFCVSNRPKRVERSLRRLLWRFPPRESSCLTAWPTKCWRTSPYTGACTQMPRDVSCPLFSERWSADLRDMRFNLNLVPSGLQNILLHSGQAAWQSVCLHRSKHPQRDPGVPRLPLFKEESRKWLQFQHQNGADGARK